MRKVSFLFLITFVLFSVTVCLAQGNRTPRRVTTVKPKPTPTPKSEDLSIISTAEDETTTNTNTQTGKKTSKRTPQPQSEQEFLRETMTDLTTEISSLSERVGQMEEKQQQLIDLDLLSRAEARAETLHQQLFDTLTKEADLKGRLAQIEYEIRPEIIERSMSIIGSTRPEDLREARKIQLNGEKQRIQDQIDMIQKNRLRLERDIANADQLVERLRNRIENSSNSPLPAKPVGKAKEKTTTDNPDKPDPDKPTE
jgi:hypothetical protein